MKIEGLEALHELRELVLDRNRIKNIGEMSFTSQWQLQELHLEENRLRELTNITVLNSLKRLFLGMNRIQVQKDTTLRYLVLFLLHFNSNSYILNMSFFLINYLFFLQYTASKLNML